MENHETVLINDLLDSRYHTPKRMNCPSSPKKETSRAMRLGPASACGVGPALQKKGKLSNPSFVSEALAIEKGSLPDFTKIYCMSLIIAASVGSCDFCAQDAYRKA